MRPVLQFCTVVVGVTALITGVGAILGAVIWTLVGVWTDSQQPPWALALTGVRTLGFYFFIWAPGTGLVVATICEHRRRQTGAARRPNLDGPTLDRG